MKTIVLREADIREIVIESIRRIMNEEMSIAPEVVNATDYVMNQFEKGNYHFKYTFEGLDEIEVSGNPVEIGSNNNKPNGLFDIENKRVYINIPTRNHMIYHVEAIQTVQHELTHAFEELHHPQSNAKRLSEQPTFEQVYRLGIHFDNTKKVWSKTDEDFRSFIYYCSNKEQDAYVNQMYAKLSSMYFMGKDAMIQEALNSYPIIMYKWIQAITADLVESKTTGKYDKTLDEYGVTHDWAIKLGKYAEKRLFKKICHGISKAIKDCKIPSFGNAPNLRRIRA